jgi:hypothetical protein
MRIRASWVGVVAAVAVAAGVAFHAGSARAEDEKKGGGGMPNFQKPIKHPLVDAMLGTWTTTSKADWGNGKAKVTFALGVGGTAVLETYENRTDGAPAEMAFHGHGIFKLSDDGKTVSLWWLDSHSPELMKLSGPVTETGYEVRGKHPGGEMHLVFEKKGDGYEFRMMGPDGKAQMTETYTKAK